MFCRPMYIRLLSRKKFKQATGVSGSSSLCVSPAQIVVSDKPGPRGLVTPPVATRAQIEGRQFYEDFIMVYLSTQYYCTFGFHSKTFVSRLILL